MHLRRSKDLVCTVKIEMTSRETMINIIREINKIENGVSSFQFYCSITDSYSTCYMCGVSKFRDY